jgi:hypothetical protein
MGYCGECYLSKVHIIKDTAIIRLFRVNNIKKYILRLLKEKQNKEICKDGRRKTTNKNNCV